MASPLLVPGLLTDAPRPRVELIPPGSVYTFGPDASALMAAAGKPLDPWQQRAVDIMLAIGPDDLWTASEFCEWCARQNGKGAILECRALAGLFLDLPFPEDLISWSAHEYRTTMEGYRRLKGLIRNLGRSDPKNANIVHMEIAPDEWIRVQFHNNNGEEAVERLDTGQRVKFFARSKGAGRGFTVGGATLLDEVFALTMEHQDASAPTQLAVPNAQTIYTSTPPLDGASGEIMYGLRERAEEGDAELAYRDWGAGGWLDEIDGDPRAFPPVPPLDLEDEALWRRTNPACPGRISLRSLDKLRRKSGRVGFARESLCIWPRQVAAAGDVINRGVWDTRADPDSMAVGRIVLSVDVSPGSMSAAIASAGRRVDGRLHTKIVRYRPGTAWVVAELGELIARHRPIKVMINSTGPAGAILADLVAAGIDVDEIKGQTWAQACAAFLTDVAEDSIRHCGQEALDDAIGCATRKYFGDAAWYWYRKDSTGDICPLAAVTAATHGFRVHGAKPERVPQATY